MGSVLRLLVVGALLLATGCGDPASQAPFPGDPNWEQNPLVQDALAEWDATFDRRLPFEFTTTTGILKEKNGATRLGQALCFSDGRNFIELWIDAIGDDSELFTAVLLHEMGHVHMGCSGKDHLDHTLMAAKIDWGYLHIDCTTYHRILDWGLTGPGESNPCNDPR